MSDSAIQNSPPRREQHLVSLLPCPFCGFAPHYSPRAESNIHPRNYWPEQVHCGICNIIFRSGEHGCTNAVHSWNHREANAECTNPEGWVP